MHLRSQLLSSRQLVKTQRTCLNVAEEDTSILKKKISNLEASLAKAEDDKKQIKA